MDRTLTLAATGGEALVTGPTLFGPPAPALTALELLDAETRLLAQATGGHLPLELALQVEQLRARRAALGPRA